MTITILYILSLFIYLFILNTKICKTKVLINSHRQRGFGLEIYTTLNCMKDVKTNGNPNTLDQSIKCVR